ncbi:FIG01200195: hypothetical protein [uncultured Gammaproteobacteria bacterium]|uniref:hypothetical protein n=1 Tax=Bathymodiolus heckerae thiotrophic gill symbiont TaxID=1052212 RepID=UPI0010B3548F|nr:hypothetical protein [Bathymodiolus heckerae thiotrophic gill symbiont]CAC9459539.1 FIG01200195: hypothetical protein [uncultured Gammaproteobacteria bacterium]SMN13602.1 hypothetical protein BHECKSOX2_725 [Bathymodiolus heckerae thiotrophic gill symbiont]SMN16836.1 hypothetical protein CRYPD_1315 [uncultured Candidatus Thioglobus sp.]
MNNIIKITASWMIALWSSYVFLGSLPYKFNGAAEPLHIFGTLGAWMSGFLGGTVGELFTQYGAYIVGGFELLTSLVLLAPIVLWSKRQKLHCIGGLMSAAVMSGAIFFHLFTPLGWVVKWSENGQIHTDAGLANAALSILVLGVVMVVLNKKS